MIYERDDYTFSYGPKPTTAMVAATCRHCGACEACPSDDLPPVDEAPNSPWSEGHAMGLVVHTKDCALMRAANLAVQR